jgi:cyclic beta-1,2-glucan synthetase
MFVETEIMPDNSAIFAHRRKRSEGEPDIAVAHFITDPAGPTRDREAETDRRAFLGRGRSILNAAAFDAGARLTASQGFVLDPIASLRRRDPRAGQDKKVCAHVLDRRRRGRPRRARGGYCPPR